MRQLVDRLRTLMGGGMSEMIDGPKATNGQQLMKIMKSLLVRLYDIRRKKNA